MYVCVVPFFSFPISLLSNHSIFLQRLNKLWNNLAAIKRTEATLLCMLVFFLLLFSFACFVLFGCLSSFFLSFKSDFAIGYYVVGLFLKDDTVEDD